MLRFGFVFLIVTVASFADDFAQSGPYADHISCHGALAGLPDRFDATRWEGSWQSEGADRKEFIRTFYRTTGGNTMNEEFKDIRRVVAKEIKVSSCSGRARTCTEGRASLHRKARERGNQPIPAHLDLVAIRLQKLGFRGFSPLHYFTSGAGNWRRGAKMVKALVPLNLKESLPEPAWQKLLALSNFALADHATRLKIYSDAVAEKSPLVTSYTVNDSEAVQTKIAELVKLARANGGSINPLEAKFAQVALLSALTEQYIHFDIWTSRATHNQIQEALKEFAADYRGKTFFEDPELNALVHRAIERYLEASQILGETHLFAHQDEVYPLSPDPKTAEFLTEEDPNGVGPGRTYETMQKTGRLAQLQRRGVQDWVFQNIEVLSMDLMAQYGAYLTLREQTGASVGVVLVPELGEYTGGYPFVATNRRGEEMNVLLEGVGVPPHLKQKLPEGGVFNTNTVFSSLQLNAVPIQGMDYEEKRSDKTGLLIKVPKMSLAFQTHTNRTEWIGGELGWDYQNFKGYTDYGRDGGATLELWREVLTSQIRSRQNSASQYLLAL